MTDSDKGLEGMATASGTANDVRDVRILLTMELGRTSQTLDQLLNFENQTLIDLDRRAGEAIDIRLNGELFARGAVVTVGEQFGVRVTEVIGRGTNDA